MGDELNQLGKSLAQTRKDADDALGKIAPHVPLLEVTRDVFDDFVPFTMDFKTYREFKTISLELEFFGPPPSFGCCADCYCTVCQVFTNGESGIILARPYIPGTVYVFVNNVPSQAFEETNPATGLVTVVPVVPGNEVTAEPSTQPIVKVCYLYKYESCT